MKFNVSVRMEDKGDFSDFEGGIVAVLSKVNRKWSEKQNLSCEKRRTVRLFPADRRELITAMVICRRGSLKVEADGLHLLSCPFPVS